MEHIILLSIESKNYCGVGFSRIILLHIWQNFTLAKSSVLEYNFYSPFWALFGYVWPHRQPEFFNSLFGTMFVFD